MTRACPFCGEEILAVAIKCKHCGTDLTGRKEQALKRSEALGLIALLLPICAVFLAWFWLSNMPLLYDPASKLYGTMAVTVLLTAILMAAEANSVGAGTESDKTPSGRRREGPVAWFFFGILLWIVAFPMWMYRRSRYGLRNLCGGAISIGIIFVAVLGLMSVALESQKEEIRRNLESTQRQLEDAQREFQRSAAETQRQLRDINY
jgi:cobalamin biosynthesis protein CobD/CbiB